MKRHRIHPPRAAGSSKKTYEISELRRQNMWYVEQIRQQEERMKTIQADGYTTNQDKMSQQEQAFEEEVKGAKELSHNRIDEIRNASQSRREHNATSAREADLEIQRIVVINCFQSSGSIHPNQISIGREKHHDPVSRRHG